MAARSLGRLAVNNTAFLLCDIQEKFRPSIRYFPEIIKVAQRMVSCLIERVSSHTNTVKKLCGFATKDNNIFRARSTCFILENANFSYLTLESPELYATITQE